MIRRGGFARPCTRSTRATARSRVILACRASPTCRSRPDLAVLSVRNERLEEAFAEAVAIGRSGRGHLRFGPLSAGEAPPLRRPPRRHGARGRACRCAARTAWASTTTSTGSGSAASRARASRRPGSIAFVAHSGSVFGALAHNDPRLRFALAVSPGEELNATVADYLAYAVERPEVKVVGLFLETARDPGGLRRRARPRGPRGVPVVALKVGRTEAAAAAALTHTGALAGSDLAYEALFEPLRRHPRRDARRARGDAPPLREAAGGRPGRARRRSTIPAASAS